VQPLDPSGVYSDDEVVHALTGRLGTRTMSFRYDRLDQNNNYLEPLDWVESCTVKNNALADLKRVANFTMLDRGSINFLKDRIRPWARLAMPDGGVVEWPLGVFLLSTPARVLGADGIVRREVDAYDQLLVLRDSRALDRYSVAAGTKYTTAIAAAAITVAHAITPDSRTLPVAMEWEPGTSKLQIINDLFSAINYESAWFDEDGTLIGRPYQSPAVRAAEYSYGDDDASVITGTTEQVLDLFDIPNIWVLLKGEPDQVSLRSVYTNSSPSSPTSTVSRGRDVVEVRTGQEAADQATLDAKAERLGFESSQVFENITFRTALMPMHSNADVINLSVSGLAIDGKYSEHTWELPLKAGARMTHTVRRVITL